MTGVVGQPVFAKREAIEIAMAFLELHGRDWALNALDRELAALCDARDELRSQLMPARELRGATL